MTVDEVSGIIGKGVMNDTLRHRENNGFQGSKKVTENEVLEINEIRLFGLMAERLFLDPIGYGNELKYGYLAKGGVRKTPA